MFSRIFYFVFPLAIVFVILALSAPADSKSKDKPAPSFREKVEQDQVEEMVSPDIPDPESIPEQPMQNNVKAAPAGHHEMEAYGRPTLKGVIASAAPLEKGVEAKVTLTLRDAGGQPVSMASLEERHTKKIHLLVLDDSMSDYQHIHPEAGKDAGTYTFSFTPHTAYSYMVFADVKPAGGTPQMIPVKLAGAEKCADPCVDKAVVDAAVFNGNKARLSFAHKTLKAGTPARGDLFLSGDDNMPLKTLEPVMGAYAHVAGFYEGFGAVTHVHPLGAEPESDTDRGSSPVSFMLHPDNPGFLKLFVQIRIGGQDIFLPFSVYVDP